MREERTTAASRLFHPRVAAHQPSQEACGRPPGRLARVWGQEVPAKGGEGERGAPSGAEAGPCSADPPGRVSVGTVALREGLALPGTCAELTLATAPQKSLRFCPGLR